MKKSVQGVIDLIRCGVAEVVYSEHYSVALTITAKGDVGTSEKTPDGDDMSPSESERNFARAIAGCAKEIEELKAVVPPGNWADFGGDAGMAEALLKRAFARAYLP